MLDVDALSATADGLIALAAEWRGDEEISHDGIASLRSGAIGDGEKWTPNITVKGGTSGFYTIKVEK